MRILVTNDDGFLSEGIYILVKKLKNYLKDATVLVVAPSTEMSAVSHKLTLKTGLLIKEEKDLIDGIQTYSVSGTPADCVKVAINHLKFFPDLVFSGINKGFNVGNDILYSGTVAAIFEARLAGISGFAVSCVYNSFEGAKYLEETLDFVFDKKRKLFSANINLPNNANSIRLTKQGKLTFESNYNLHEDGLYYLEGDPIIESEGNDESSDVYAVNNEIISVSFLTSDRVEN